MLLLLWIIFRRRKFSGLQSQPSCYCCILAPIILAAVQRRLMASVSQDVGGYAAQQKVAEGLLRSAPAVLKNREPIFSVIGPILSEPEVGGDYNGVLEIGSGTGEHAIFFAERLPHVRWFTSDLQINHQYIQSWLNEAKLPNTVPPLELDASAEAWSLPEELSRSLSAVFLANVLHIVSWELCQALFKHIGHSLRQSPAPSRHFLTYGPFNFDNKYTSESNEKFDEWLKARDPNSAIRNFEDIVALADAEGLKLVKDHAMPANNRLLHFQM